MNVDAFYAELRYVGTSSAFCPSTNVTRETWTWTLCALFAYVQGPAVDEKGVRSARSYHIRRCLSLGNGLAFACRMMSLRCRTQKNCDCVSAYGRPRDWRTLGSDRYGVSLQVWGTRSGRGWWI